jgi:dTMP kinase
LVSVEGLSGVGKTHLTTLLLQRLPDGCQPLLIQEFSQRSGSGRHDLGRDLLHSLVNAAHGDHFLRGGHPGTETLLLLAIKMFDYEEHAAPALRRGQLVLEGRSIHSTAVYQSLITNPHDDEAAYQHACEILALAEQWRPLPDLTVLLADNVDIALQRAERRDTKVFTTEQRQLHHRAAALFERLAAVDPQRVPIVDRRLLGLDEAINRMIELIGNASTGCLSALSAADGRSARHQPGCQHASS